MIALVVNTRFVRLALIVSLIASATPSSSSSDRILVADFTAWVVE